MTYYTAALTLLAYTDRPLTVGELTSLAIDRGLIHPRGRTPDRSMSSVLYRRMAADPDAPIVSSDGQFRLRGRAPVGAAASALRPAIRTARRQAGGRRSARTGGSTDRRSSLPPPPAIELPRDLPISAPIPARAMISAHAVASLAERLQRVVQRYEREEELALSWDVFRTYNRRVAPLLTLLGYRRVDRGEHTALRGRISHLLQASKERSVLLETVKASHVLNDTDARGALARAATAGTSWVLVTNGNEWRLYTTTLAGAFDEPAGALVLRVDLRGIQPQNADSSMELLWVLTRAAVAEGALEGYLAARAVGAALLQSLEQPDSAITGAIVAAVQQITGLRLPATAVARQAHLAVRTGRTREGAPVRGAVLPAASITMAVEDRHGLELQRSAS